VLFADIKGSTEHIDGMDPEQSVQLLKPVVDAMIAAVQKYSGTVNRVQGDGIMAIFGAPISHEDHAVRACHAALEIQSSTRSDDQLPVRVGLNTGEVVVRSIENDLTVEYEADGPTVHLAARMEQMAEPGTILLTGNTYRLAQGLVTVESQGQRTVRGLSAPVAVFNLRGLSASRNRMEARSGAGLSPFVGRESELTVLDRALARSAERHGQVVALSGEAGVGKSRVVREFVSKAEARGWTVRITGGDPLGITASYQPIIDLLKNLFDITDDDDAETVATKTSDAVLALDPALASRIPALHALLDVKVDASHWAHQSPEDKRQRIIEAVCALTLTRANALQLMLVFEDLHWVDGETQSILDSLVDNLAGTRLMVLVTYRPEHLDRWTDRSYHTRLRIDPLDAHDADEFLNQSLGRDASLEPVKRMLMERTQGVPFFLEETIRGLTESGDLQGQPGAYQLTSELAALAIPATVQSVLAARIDRLYPRDKEVLQVASVIGRFVALSLLESVAEMPSAAVTESLASLQRAEFIHLSSSVPEPVYAFRHALTQDVAYASLLKETRRTIHERLIGAIEHRYAARLDEHFAVLGRHALDSELWSKADRYLSRAGDRAIARSAYHEVIGLLEQQLLALNQLPEDYDVEQRALEAHLNLRSPYGSTGDVPKMVEHLREARALAGKLGDKIAAARVELLSSSVIDLYGDLDETVRLFEATRARALADGDPGLARQNQITISMRSAFGGRLDYAIETTADALSSKNAAYRHERFGMTGTWTVQLLTVRAICLSLTGRFAEARQAAAHCVEIANETARPFDQGIAYWTLGALGLWSGQLDGCVDALVQGYEICTNESVGILMPNLAPTLAYALCLEERIDEARVVNENAPIFETKSPAFWFHGWGAAFAGLSRVHVGELDVGYATLKNWQALTEGHPLDGLEAGIQAALARCVHAKGGNTDETRAATVAAIDKANAMGALPEAARCQLELARLVSSSDRDLAMASARAACDVFETLEMPFWADEARGLLPSQ
jgi:class 3 adenylate cyclase/tetratricopeptide (TPR) repeat protein